VDFTWGELAILLFAGTLYFDRTFRRKLTLLTIFFGCARVSLMHSAYWSLLNSFPSGHQSE